jgi:hypothetical protein
LKASHDSSRSANRSSGSDLADRLVAVRDVLRVLVRILAVVRVGVVVRVPGMVGVGAVHLGPVEAHHPRAAAVRRVLLHEEPLGSNQGSAIRRSRSVIVQLPWSGRFDEGARVERDELLVVEPGQERAQAYARSASAARAGRRTASAASATAPVRGAPQAERRRERGCPALLAVRPQPQAPVRRVHSVSRSTSSWPEAADGRSASTASSALGPATLSVTSRCA